MNSTSPTPTSTNLCDFCSNPASFACGKCSKAHYCSKEHQLLMWKDFHRIICGKPATTFFQPDLILDKFVLLQKLVRKGEVQDQSLPAVLIDTLKINYKKHHPTRGEIPILQLLNQFNMAVNMEDFKFYKSQSNRRQGSYDERNEFICFCRIAIQDRLSRDADAFLKFLRVHKRQMAFFQAADVDFAIQPLIDGDRNSEFVIQYFNKAALTEIEATDSSFKSGSKSSFNVHRRSIFKLEKILQDWKPKLANTFKEHYIVRVKMARHNLETKYFEALQGESITTEERKENKEKYFNSIGVELRMPVSVNSVPKEPFVDDLD